MDEDEEKNWGIESRGLSGLATSWLPWRTFGYSRWTRYGRDTYTYEEAKAKVKELKKRFSKTRDRSQFRAVPLYTYE